MGLFFGPDFDYDSIPTEENKNDIFWLMKYEGLDPWHSVPYPEEWKTSECDEPCVSFASCNVDCLFAGFASEEAAAIAKEGALYYFKELGKKNVVKLIPFVGWASTAYTLSDMYICLIECIWCEN